MVTAGGHVTGYILYTAAEEGIPLPPPKKKPAWALVPLILMIGLGSHATNHALTPVQPELEALGLSPIVYAMVTFAPQLGHLLLPTLWAVAYGRRPRLALASAPFMLLLGTASLAVGLALHRTCGDNAVLATCSLFLMGLGLVLYMVSRAGISVLQHCTLAQCLPGDLVGGLCVMVASTHLIAAAVSLLAPRILHAYGLAGVQLALLPPAIGGTVAGFLLGAWMPTPQDPPEQTSPRNRVSELKPFLIYCRRFHRQSRSSRSRALPSHAAAGLLSAAFGGSAAAQTRFRSPERHSASRPCARRPHRACGE